MRSRFEVVKVSKDIVFIADMNEGRSVTNDAENVTQYLHVLYPGKRIVYRDTMNMWDELVHNGGKFQCFARFIGDAPELKA